MLPQCGWYLAGPTEHQQQRTTGRCQKHGRTPLVIRSHKVKYWCGHTSGQSCICNNKWITWPMKQMTKQHLFLRHLCLQLWKHDRFCLIPLLWQNKWFPHQIVVTNTGNVSLIMWSPVDVMPDGSMGLLSDHPSLSNDDANFGEVWTYTTSYTVTQSDINNGEDLINSVSVDTDETLICYRWENTPIKQPCQRSRNLLKTGTYVDLAPVGYNAVMKSIILLKFKTQEMSHFTMYILPIIWLMYWVDQFQLWIPVMLDNTTISAIYTIQQSDINNGSFSNQAFAYGTPPSGPEVSDDDTDDQTFIQNCAFSWLKGLFVDLAPARFIMSVTRLNINSM